MIEFNHGGELGLAAQTFGIPRKQWLDLSTGINPEGWPVPPIPPHCWQRLPEENDGLLEAAARYYDVDQARLLAVPGSQFAIQTLPKLFAPADIVMPEPSFSEHRRAWLDAGHKVISVTPDEHCLNDAIEHNSRCRYAVVINPNNPTGHLYEPSTIEHWRRILARRQGFLIVDEAFIDCHPTHSCLAKQAQSGMIVLRSLGKFFGLAGLRIGFVLAPPAVQHKLAHHLGPWSINHPGSYVATRALLDTQWQHATQQRLAARSHALNRVLRRFVERAPAATPALSGCALFQSIHWPQQAARIFSHLAAQAVLVRHFPQAGWLRFGLPADEQQLQKLEQLLSQTPLVE